jgi:hypothetical protein
MISIFPPFYGLTSLFNISEDVIFEIIEKGFSEIFYNKCKKLLDIYNDSKGIDENKLLIYKKLHKRCKDLYEKDLVNDNIDKEINKIIYFLNKIVNEKTDYFKNYVFEGRRLKKVDQEKYIQHKLSSACYMPFGVFENRENKSFIKSSNLLYFDIDVPLIREEKCKVIQTFIEDPYIKTSWFSFSGKGFGFIVKSKWNTENEMKKTYYRFIEYFTLILKEKGIEKRILDTQVCSLNRINFISYGIIKNKVKFEYFPVSNDSDELYQKLFIFYNKNSKLNIPNRLLTEDDATKIYNNQENKILLEESNYLKFLNRITTNLSFNGSDDYNGAIKSYVAKIFRYNIDENLIKNFLFEKIPYNNKTEKCFDNMIKSFSRYIDYHTIDPYVYK